MTSVPNCPVASLSPSELGKNITKISGKVDTKIRLKKRITILFPVVESCREALNSKPLLWEMN